MKTLHLKKHFLLHQLKTRSKLGLNLIKLIY